MLNRDLYVFEFSVGEVWGSSLSRSIFPLYILVIVVVVVDILIVFSLLSLPWCRCLWNILRLVAIHIAQGRLGVNLEWEST